MKNLFSGAIIFCTALYGMAGSNKVHIKLEVWISSHLHLVSVNLVVFEGIYNNFFRRRSETLKSRVWSKDMALTCKFTIGIWCHLVKCKLGHCSLWFQKARTGKGLLSPIIWCPRLNKPMHLASSIVGTLHRKSPHCSGLEAHPKLESSKIVSSPFHI